MLYLAFAFIFHPCANGTAGMSLYIPTGELNWQALNVAVLMRGISSIVELIVLFPGHDTTLIIYLFFVTMFLSVILSRPVLPRCSPDVNVVAVFQTVCKSVGSGQCHQSKPGLSKSTCWVLYLAIFRFPLCVHLVSYSFSLSLSLLSLYRYLAIQARHFCIFSPVSFLFIFLPVPDAHVGSTLTQTSLFV